MMANLTRIAGWVKLSGTAEELEGLRFLEERMASYGWRTAIEMHDAYISLPSAARVLVDGASIKAITHSFSLSSPREGLSAVPVYLGHGTAEDFAGKDLRGALLLLEGMATPPVAKRATQAGAAGQLHISHHEHIHEMCISPVWGNPSGATRNDLPRTVVGSVSQQDGAAIRDALAAGKRPAVTLHADVDTGWRKTPILVCDLDGPGGAADPFVLLSGHHDTWYHGVMDNGSANAGMLEVARLVAQRHGAWRRGMRVCFWSGHSHGRYSSSAWYADEHWDELDRRCVAHVNVDSLGGKGATVLANTKSTAELRRLAAEAVQRHADQVLKGTRRGRNSDESFVGIGIPSIFGSISAQPHQHEQARNALGWWWHTPGDLLDKIDEANLVRDTRVLLHGCWTLLSEPVVPLDHGATAATLAAELEQLTPSLAERFDLAPIISEVATLRALATAIDERRDASPAAALPAANAALMRASRALVPIDCAEGDRFTHPDALPLAAWAPLQPLRALATSTPGSADEKFIAVDAVRARNRLVHALREATAALDEARQALGG
ncbi:M28 family peptidase [Neoroseomonas lacus]|nr:M28 family peptidase [Neoroseomonas lacus]